MSLERKRIAILVEEDFEDSELKVGVSCNLSSYQVRHYWK